MDKYEKILDNLIMAVKPLDAEAREKAKAQQDRLAKPPRSLGRLEDLSVQMAGIAGFDADISKKRLLVFAADNGVVEEGVSSAPQSVTLAQTINLTRGKTGAAALSRFYGNELYVYDVGVNAEISDEKVINKKIALGTKNIAKEPAMTRSEALRAVNAGIEAALDAKRDGVSVIGVGEMGIGNTTTSSAVLAALTDLKAAAVTGRGGGISNESYARKLQVIDDAIDAYKPDRNDVLDILSKVGGFDICAMTGAFIAGASEGMAVVIDGFISAVAALCAAKLCPPCRSYMIASHKSREPGYVIAMRELGLRPLFDLEMRLGEGSGCPIAFSMIDAAWFVLHNMASFTEAGIIDDYLDEIRNEVF